MDILMVYWNSVWSHSQRDRSSLLSQHSNAELDAYERRLQPRKRRAGEATVVRIDGRPWVAEHDSS
jgi:hypothetical protein